MTFDLDALLDEAVLHGALTDGRDPGLIAASFGTARVIGAAREATGRAASNGKANRWTPAEKAFLRQVAGVLSDEDIGARLGRAVAGVRVRRRRMGLPGPMVHPDYVTGNEMADALGIDGHAAIKLIERGLLPAEIAPVSGRQFWRMRRRDFYVWAVNPMNWPYFYRSVRRPERIRDGKLRRLIVLRAAAWGDEWLTPGEVAVIHGVHHTDVNRFVNAGRLPSVKWGNHMVRRSDATRPGLRFYKGKGAGLFERSGTPAGDAFLVLAVAVGIPANQIALLNPNLNHTTVVMGLHQRGLIPWLIRSFALPVLYRADAGDGVRSTGGLLWADWRPVAHRFRRLAAAWPRHEAGELRRIADMRDRTMVNGVLRAAVAWNLGPEHPLAAQLHYRVRAAEEEAFGLWYGWVEAAGQVLRDGIDEVTEE